MDVRFVTPDLRRLDELKSEALALPFFEDERPLRGALGLVDWRLAGQLSRLLLAGHATGAPGDAVLVPTRRRLPFDKLFLFGAGRSDAFDEKAFRRVSDHMLTALERAWVRSSVLALPGRSLERIEAPRAMELFIRVASKHPGQEQVTLVETSDGARAMGPVLERERRRERAQDLSEGEAIQSTPRTRGDRREVRRDGQAQVARQTEPEVRRLPELPARPVVQTRQAGPAVQLVITFEVTVSSGPEASEVVGDRLLTLVGAEPVGGLPVDVLEGYDLIDGLGVFDADLSLVAGEAGGLNCELRLHLTSPPNEMPASREVQGFCTDFWLAGWALNLDWEQEGKDIEFDSVFVSDEPTNVALRGDQR